MCIKNNTYLLQTEAGKIYRKEFIARDQIKLYQKNYKFNIEKIDTSIEKEKIIIILNLMLTKMSIILLI